MKLPILSIFFLFLNKNGKETRGIWKEIEIMRIMFLLVHGNNFVYYLTRICVNARKFFVNYYL